MSCKRLFFAVVFLLFLFFAFPFSHAITERGSMKIFAVTTEGEGLSAGLNLRISPGNGKVWVDVDPLVGTSTQSTARNAVIVAKGYSKEALAHDYFFDINSNASVVEGPSAGAAMALLLVSQLEGKILPSTVSITGTITEEGYVGAVGGVYEKALEAGKQGIKLFMIPKGESKQTIKVAGEIKSINLTEYAPRELGFKVVEVRDLDDALKYAFSDILELDVNVPVVVPDFIPTKLERPEYLDGMKKLTEKYISDAKAAQDEAKNALSTTLTGDSSLTSSLLEIINANDMSLRFADILYEQNYLYSAANYAFVSKVNAFFVRDVSSNPSLLEPNSTAFDLKLLSLKRDISDLRENLSGKIFVDNLEWQIGSMQRLAWAENYYNIIKGKTQVVVVNYEDGSVNQKLDDSTKNLMNYEFAVAWVQAAREFNETAKSDGSAVEINVKNLSDLGEAIEKYIVSAEDFASSIALDETVKMRLNSAKTALASKSYLSALYDAASAHALASAAMVSAGKSTSDLNSLLDERIKNLEPMMGSSHENGGNKYLWPRLYFDHAKYFLEAASFYSEYGVGAKERESLEDGLGLVSLASELASATDLARESVGREAKKVSLAVPIQANQSLEGGKNTFLLQNGLPDSYAAVFGAVIVLLVMVIISLAFAINSLIKRHNRYDLVSQINQLKLLEKGFYEKHEKGLLSDEEFAERVSKISEELCALDSLRREKANYVENVDKLKYAMHAIECQLSDLKRLYSKGLYTDDEFLERINNLKRQFADVRSAMKEEAESLKSEESEIRREIDSERKEFSSSPAMQKTRAAGNNAKMPLASEGNEKDSESFDNEREEPFFTENKEETKDESAAVSAPKQGAAAGGQGSKKKSAMPRQMKKIFGAKSRKTSGK